MKSLFIDNAEEMVLGILNDNLEFEQYYHFQDRQNASRIHARLNNLLQEQQVSLEDIKKIYITSGPGSYTGVRVVEGIAQIMKWQGKDIFSFYHFEIPAMSGIGQGVWVAPAWKEELFVYFWEGERYSKKLISSLKFEFTGKEYSFGNRCNGFSVCSSRKLLLEQSSTIFECVHKRGKYLPPYYYRKIEQEFKKGV